MLTELTKEELLDRIKVGPEYGSDLSMSYADLERLLRDAQSQRRDPESPGWVSAIRLLENLRMPRLVVITNTEREAWIWRHAQNYVLSNFTTDRAGCRSYAPRAAEELGAYVVVLGCAERDPSEFKGIEVIDKRI